MFSSYGGTISAPQPSILVHLCPRSYSPVHDFQLSNILSAHFACTYLSLQGIHFRHLVVWSTLAPMSLPVTRFFVTAKAHARSLWQQVKPKCLVVSSRNFVTPRPSWLLCLLPFFFFDSYNRAGNREEKLLVEVLTTLITVNLRQATGFWEICTK